MTKAKINRKSKKEFLVNSCFNKQLNNLLWHNYYKTFKIR